ncbi:MAG: tetratricopeptide repeat protein [Sphingobacteriales bacterium]|nr:tetratricopeptide repeat protein [Sphingobacteriales bacterium]
MFAQKNKAKNQEVVIVAGKVLSAEDSSRVTQLYYEAIKEKIIENTVLAIDYFNQILQIDPSNHNAFYQLAQIYYNKGDEQQAKENAQKAVTIKTDNEWYWLLLANIYQQQQDYNLLNYALNELIKLSPNKVEYFFDKAEALEMLGKDDEALDIYQHLEQQIGLTDDILRGRQKIYLKKGEIDKAAADLHQLMLNNPSDVRYLLYLGDLYYSNKRFDDALKVYQQAKALDSSNPFTSLAIAQILASEQKNEEAFDEFKNAFQSPQLNIDQKVKIVLQYFKAFPDAKATNEAEQLAQILTKVHPDDPKAFSIYGDVLYQKNDLKNAKIAYQEALALNKNVFAIWDQLCRIELSLNDIDGLIQTGEEALTLFPNQYQLYFYTALAYHQKGNDQKAISYFNQCLAFDIDDKNIKSQIYSNLAEAYQSQKKYKESDDAYEKALDLAPRDAYTLNNYAYFLSLRGEHLDKAEMMSLKSNQLEPNNAAFQDTYAWVLFKLKKYKDAQVWIQKAIANNPKSATQFEHLGDILYQLGDLDGALENWKKALELNPSKTLVQQKINEKKYLE